MKLCTRTYVTDWPSRRSIWYGMSSDIHKVTRQLIFFLISTNTQLSLEFSLFTIFFGTSINTKNMMNKKPVPKWFVSILFRINIYDRRQEQGQAMSVKCTNFYKHLFLQQMWLQTIRKATTTLNITQQTNTIIPGIVTFRKTSFRPASVKRF